MTASQGMGVDPLVDALRAAVRSKRVWGKKDELPAEVERILAEVGAREIAEVVRVAESGIEGARLAALLVVRHPDWPWPVRQTARAIARRLSKDDSEQQTARQDALVLLVRRERGVLEYLIEELVLGVADNVMEVSLVADLCEHQRECPGVFLDALKRMAAVPGQQMVLSGMIFRGFSRLPPDADEEIRAEINLACDRFDDGVWIRRGDEARLLELFGDVLSLAGILLRRDVFAVALERVCAFLSQRQWGVSVVAAIVAPLVIWKGEVGDLAPWMEHEYEACLTHVGGDVPWGKEARDLAVLIRNGYYRQLKRNLIIERKQVWREWARERARRGGGTIRGGV